MRQWQSDDERNKTKPEKKTTVGSIHAEEDRTDAIKVENMREHDSQMPDNLH